MQLHTTYLAQFMARFGLQGVQEGYRRATKLRTFKAQQYLFSSRHLEAATGKYVNSESMFSTELCSQLHSEMAK